MIALLAGPASAGKDLPVDRDHEVMQAADPPYPVRGPASALVTVDLFLPLGSAASGPAFSLLLRLLDEDPDLRLVYHPARQAVDAGARHAGRGAEALWEARAEGHFWALADLLHARPGLLAPEQEDALLTEAARVGLSRDRLRDALLLRRHRPALEELDRRERDFALLPPEIWVNGRRLRGAALTEINIRDEIQRQRDRARAVLREGVARAVLADRLVALDRQERGESVPAVYQAALGGPPARPERARTPRVRVDVAGSPARGPEVAPVQAVFFGSFTDQANHDLAEALTRVMERQPGQVRLVIKLLPGDHAGQQAAWALAWIAVHQPGRFWPLQDRLVHEIGRRYRLGSRDVERVIGEMGLQVPVSAPPGDAAWQRLQQDQAEARRLRIDHAPALVVNGLVLRGLPADLVERLVRREAQRGCLARWLGQE